MQHEIFLIKGWNLISFFQENIDFNILKENVMILEIKSIKQSYHQKIPDSLNTLDKITLGEGYWINTLEDTTLKIIGPVNKKDIRINLKEGWNLIGYPFDVKKNLSELPDEFITIKNINKSFHSQIPNELNTLKYLESDNAYFVKSNSEKEFIFNYPFLEVTLNQNKEILGLLSLKETNGKLKNFNKEEYIINTEKYDISYDGNLNKYQYSYYKELKEIITYLGELKLNVFFGEHNNESIIGGVDFLNSFKVFSFYYGKISIDKTLFNDELKIIIIRFNESSEEKITIDLINSKITFSHEGLHFILDVSIIQSMNTNDKIIKSSDFIYDFKLENINIKDIKIMENYNLLKINKINYSYNDNKLDIICFSENLIEIKFKKIDKIDKTMEFTLSSNGLISDSSIIQVIKNEKFSISNNNNLYEILIDWDGELEVSDENLLSVFVEPNNYLYWYDLETIIFNKFTVGSYNKDYSYEIEFTEKNKDYIVFNLDLLYDKYYFILIKDSKIKGCINIYFRNNYTTDILKWSIYSGKKFSLNNNLEITISWYGDYDTTGYSILNTKEEHQRDVGLSLNSFKLLKYKDFCIKIHYMIGDDKNSIDLKEWKSYNNYLDKLETIIRYTIDYVKMFDLLFPLKEYQIIKNGGSSDYDIYIIDIENQYVKGYTAAESYAYHTDNHNDVITYMVISSKLSSEWLNTVFLHEFFHSIQGSYDWFDSNWISEGLATAFEYNLSRYSELSPRYFIRDFLGKRNLSLKYDENFVINNGIFRVYNNITKDNRVGNIILYIEEMYISDFKVDISKIDLNLIGIYSYQYESKILKAEKITYRNSTILKIKLESREKILYFNLLYNNTVVNNAVFSFRGRYYGTFTFFSF